MAVTSRVSPSRVAHPLPEGPALAASLPPKGPTSKPSPWESRALTCESGGTQTFSSQQHGVYARSAEILGSRLAQVNFKLALARRDLEMPHTMEERSGDTASLSSGSPPCFLHPFLRVTLLSWGAEYRKSLRTGVAFSAVSPIPITKGAWPRDSRDL